MKLQLFLIATVLGLTAPIMHVAFIASTFYHCSTFLTHSLADVALGADHIAAREPSHEELMFAARDVLNTIEDLNARDETFRNVYARDLDAVNEFKARELLAEMLTPLVRRKQGWYKTCPDCGKGFTTEGAFLAHAYDGCKKTRPHH
jgi:hypothetical protein